MAPMSESPVTPDLAALLDELRCLGAGAPTQMLVSLIPRLRQMARKHLPQQSMLRAGLDSEDLLQEGLLQLVREAHNFRGTTWPEFLAFVHAILGQKMQQQARRQQVRRGELHASIDAISLPAGKPTPSVDAAAAEEQRRMRRLVGELPEPYRTALQLRLDGCDNASIAAHLGIAPETVRQRLSRAVKILHQRW